MGSEARARIGLVVLLVGTLASFEHLFASGEYWGPSLLGMVLALGIAVAGRRLGMSTTLVVIASAALLVWYLLLVFESGATAYGLPTPAALRRVWADLMVAYDLSAVDYAPVPLRTGYAIFAIAVTWTLTTVGEIATFRWKRPLVASAPCVALFTFLMIVGESPLGTWLVLFFLASLFTYWGLESTHRLRAWGRWVTAWREDDDEPSGLVGDMARRMGVVCVLAALVIPLFIPALEEGFLSWRNQVGEGPGGAGGGSGEGSGSGIVDPLVSVVPELIQQSETEMFRVDTDLAPEAPRPYWRMQSLMRFDGRTWFPPNSGTTEQTVQFGLGEGGLLSATSVPRAVGLPLPTVAADVTQRFTIRGFRNQHMPVAGTPLKMDIADEDQAGNVRVNATHGDLRLTTGLTGGFFYEVTSSVAMPSYRELKRTEVVLEEGTEYVQLPAGLDPDVRSLALEWTRGKKTDLERLIAIQDELRLGFDYDDQIEPAKSDDYLAQFLFDTKTGYCQQFATAFAVLARTLGYPTRVVVGFLPGESDDATPDEFVVRGSDAHAWPEVYFPGHGWIPFEPTPRNGATGPAHTVPPTQLPEGGGGDTGGDLGPQPIGEGNRRPENFRGSDDPRLIGVEEGARAAREAEAARRWREGFRRVVTVLAAIALFFLASVPLLKQARATRLYRRARDARGLAAAGFIEFQQEAAEFTRGRGSAESASSFARRVAATRGLPMDEAIRLAAIYDAAQYAPAEVEPNRIDEARSLAKRLRARLWTSSTLWEKALRLFRPTGLLGRSSAG